MGRGQIGGALVSTLPWEGLRQAGLCLGWEQDSRVVGGKMVWVRRSQMG